MKHQPKLLTLLFLAVGIASLAPLTLQAQPADFAELHGHCGDIFGALPPFPPYLRGIALTDAQADTVFTVLHNQQPQLRQKVKALHKTQEDLRALAKSSQYDDAEAKRLADAAAKIAAEIDLIHARTDHQLYFVLNDAQRKQVDTIKERFEKDRPPPI